MHGMVEAGEVSVIPDPGQCGKLAEFRAKRFRSRDQRNHAMRRKEGSAISTLPASFTGTSKR